MVSIRPAERGIQYTQPVVTYDRRGDPIWFDDFESGTLHRWYTQGGAASIPIVLSTTAAKNGAWSCRMKTLAIIANTSLIQIYKPYPIVSKLGAEFSFATADNTHKIRLEHIVFDGARFHAGWFEYRANNGEVCYVNPAGSCVPVGTKALKKEIYAFHTAKLVIDFVNDRYERMMLDGEEWNLSTVGLYSGVDAVTSPCMYTKISVISITAATTTTYMDGVVLTVKEPPN